MRALYFALLDFLTLSALTSVRGSSNGPPSVSLAELALQKVLTDASPIFGGFEANGTSTNTSTWMKNYPDSTKLVHLNILGVAKRPRFGCYSQIRTLVSSYSSAVQGQFS
jgi:1-phosphatidylinositol phosphodiesterase